jgi:D-alanine--poly(phosphoribitol) ligase subunit 2
MRISDGDLRRLVIDWLDDNYHFGEAEQKITDDDMSFLETGILDSLGFVQLILHLENQVQIKIDRKELSRRNFDSLRKIVDYVRNHPDVRRVS